MPLEKGDFRMSLLIGVDGGGTGCRVAIAEENGNVLARASAGPANIATNLQKSRDNFLGAIDEAFDTAGINRAEIANATAVLGLAGANLGDYAAQLLPTLPFARANIVSDAETTLVGAIGDQNGCIAAIGTGSVYGRRDENGFFQIGGWGFLLGDDGSGARLGCDFLHITILAYDGVAPSSLLTREILEQYDNNPSNIVEQAKKFTPGEFGRLAPRIIKAAALGDENAEGLLVHHTDIVRKSIDAVGFNPDQAFCMHGGLGQVYLARLPETYQKEAHAAKGNALDGAMTLAGLLLAKS